MSILLKVKKGVGHKMDADDNRSFEQWMQAVDRLVGYRGLSVYDLPDCCYRDWYDNRLRPIRAANRALSNAMGDYP
jgi:hypothetical protein